jgi:AraC-like DNA-binding protein
MTVERLPDLPTPRGSHRTVIVGNEIVLLGGQTNGFKPLETAEYYSGGSWHTVRSLYAHINGFAAPLPDGRILLGGGSEADFGIGQSWGTEIYDPVSHSFTSSGIMSVKRAMSSALSLPDGRVIIAGNWRAEDSYETWTAEAGFVPGEALSPGWAEPYILPASEDDIIVFGPWNPRGDDPGGLVDHLDGAPEQVPLLDDYAVCANYDVFPGDMQIADYTYLIPAQNRSTDEQVVVKVASGKISLLEMETPLTGKGPEGGPVTWTLLQVDRPFRIAWVQGLDSVKGCLCLARIAYDATFDGGSASVSYYYADIPGGAPSGCARLMPGGRFILAGGRGWKEGMFPVVVDNFKAYSSAYILHTEMPSRSGMPLWTILVIILGVVCVAVIAVIHSRRKAGEPDASAEEGRLTRNLMEEMSALIEEKELYRRKNLRITDVASELATNKTYVSVLLNNMSGESFTSMITRYRVQYAQKLLREHPDMILDEVAEESGFSSRTTFFRNFKALTGMTPQEWKRQK